MELIQMLELDIKNLQELSNQRLNNCNPENQLYEPGEVVNADFEHSGEHPEMKDDVVSCKEPGEIVTNNVTKKIQTLYFTDDFEVFWKFLKHKEAYDGKANMVDYALEIKEIANILPN